MADDELETGEAHPCSWTALEYIKKNLTARIKDAIYSNALTDNRTAIICAGTLARLEKGDKVSDRYIMGLAWFIYELLQDRHVA